MGVIQAGVQGPIFAFSAVTNGKIDAAVFNLTEVGGGVVGGSDVPRDELGHQQILGGFAIDVRLNGEFVVEQTQLDAEVELLTFLPFHVGVGGRRKG